ncbi:hypothetical protein GN156_12145 [bacterium LRH843]|nr:hypothetical protein [bacterium LRH843]
MKKIVFLIITLMISVIGCNSATSEHGGEDHVNELGDVRELTSSADELPAFLEKYDETIASIYAEVPHHKDLLEHMPCYCGCKGSVGHRSSYDCFMYKHQDDGAVVWDDHGAKCGVCLEIAHYSIELHKKGVPATEIRTFIDDRYKEGYLEPTDTPMPAGV